MVLQKRYEYSEILYPPVLARPDGLKSPRSRAIDPAFVQTLTGPDGIVQRIIPPGCFMASIPGSTKLRPLPRTRLTAEITTSSTALAVSPKTARLFRSVGIPDVLTVAVPYARADFAGTWANNDTATMTVANRSVTHTVSNFTTLTALAVAAAATYNASPLFAGVAEFYAENQYIHVISDNGNHSTISVAKSAAGTFTLNGSVTSLVSGVAVGTVQAVDTNTHTITLAAASTSRLAAGVPIGAAAYSPTDAYGQGWGLVSPNQPVDLEWEPKNEYGLFISGTFYRDRLPYWDGQLAELFDEIVFD